MLKVLNFSGYKNNGISEHRYLFLIKSQLIPGKLPRVNELQLIFLRL